MSKKIFLLDTNVLVDYYLRKENKVISVMNKLEDEKKNRKCLIFVPNFCIGETFSIFAKICYHDRDISEKEFEDAKWRFVDDISRDYQYKRYQHYNHIELNRYHLIHAHLVYKPAWECVFKLHMAGKHKTRKGYPKFPSTFDLLVIAEGIEMTSLYSDKELVLLTSDRLMLDICAYLTKLKNDEKIKLIKRGNAQTEDFKNISSFNYPKAINAKDYNKVMEFLS